MTKNDEGYCTRKMSYPYIKKNLKFLEDEENMNINNGNLNENINYNSNQKDEQNNINTKNENNEEKNEIILENQLLIPEIMNIYQKAKKFDYNFELINLNFKDFIHKFSFENKENNNTENMPSNNIQDNNIEKRKYINESYSYLSPSKNNSIEKVNNGNYLSKYIILENGKKQINKDLIKCNCKNSYCLKFYCECFSNGKYCEKICSCCNCKNTYQYENVRQEKYKNILSRNPKAIYQINSTKKSWTCTCKNSNCTKNYCDCFQNGKSCTSKCRCVNCLNKIPNNNNYNNNNNGKGKIRRIRGGKKLFKNNIFLTPKKRRNNNRNNEYSKNINNNQSTAEFTENNNNKKNIFNKSKCKAISLKLNMNDE